MPPMQKLSFRARSGGGISVALPVIHAHMESAAMEIELVRRNRDWPEIRASRVRQNQNAPSSAFEPSFSTISAILWLESGGGIVTGRSSHRGKRVLRGQRGLHGGGNKTLFSVVSENSVACTSFEPPGTRRLQKQKSESAKPCCHLARLFVSVDGLCGLRPFGIVVLSRGKSEKEIHPVRGRRGRAATSRGQAARGRRRSPSRDPEIEPPRARR
jgi:hypothetical protein